MEYRDYRYDEDRKKELTIITLIIIIVILLATIAGLTYSIFNSGDGDGKIGINIISGECKIDIVDAKDNSLIGDVLNFVVFDGRDEILFEPGAVYYTEGFQVKNIGNIPINFRVNISNDDETDMESFNEAFEFWVTNDLTNLKTAERLTSFTGQLNVDDKSDTYYLVIKMKETAGNEFQNQIYSGIGITVHAVPASVEIDQ